MIVGGYVLHLYCDSGRREFDQKDKPGHQHGMSSNAAEFSAETGPQARARARRSGWRLDVKRDRALCPICSGKKKPLLER